MTSPLKGIAFAALSAAALLASAQTVKAVTLEEACTRFASKMGEAQASSDPDKVKMVYSKGTQRIASRFNGATCPNIKAP